MSGGAGRSAGRRRLSPPRTGPGAGVLSGPRRSGKWGHSSLTTRGRIRPNLAPVRPSPHRCLSTDRAASRQPIRSDGWSRSCSAQSRRTLSSSARHSGSRDRRGLVGHTGRFSQRRHLSSSRRPPRRASSMRARSARHLRPEAAPPPHRVLQLPLTVVGNEGIRKPCFERANTARTSEWVCVCICGRHESRERPRAFPEMPVTRPHWGHPQMVVILISTGPLLGPVAAIMRHSPGGSDRWRLATAHCSSVSAPSWGRI